MNRHEAIAGHRRLFLQGYGFWWVALFLLTTAAVPARAEVRRLTHNTWYDTNPRINNRGQMVWQGGDSIHEDVYVWDGAAVQQLTQNGQFEHEPQINDAGQVIWRDENGIHLWQNGAVRQITGSPALGGIGINRSGQVVWSGNDGLYGQIYRWDGVDIRQLTHDATWHSSPQVNGRGQVAWLTTDGIDPRVDLWDGATVRRLSRPGVTIDQIQMNDSGWVVWRGLAADDGLPHIYLWDGTTTRQLGPMTGYGPQINQAGVVVWHGSDRDGQHLFRWDGSTTRSLRDTGLEFAEPVINDRGQVFWRAPAGKDLEIYRWDRDVLEPLTHFPASDRLQSVFVVPGGVNNAGQVACAFDGEIYLYTPPAAGSLDLEPTPIVSGSPVRGTVTLVEAAPAGGMIVHLTSDNPAAAKVPESVTVPAGATSASFPVTTQPVATEMDVRLSAAVGDAAWKATLHLWPISLTALELRRAAVTGGHQVPAVLRLSGGAPEGGGVVTLTSDPPLVTAPAVVVVPVNRDSVAFWLDTATVTTATTVRISATFGGVTRTASLLVKPLALQSLYVSPAQVVGRTMGGAVADGRVTLEAAAVGAPAVVTLSTDQPSIIRIPATVAVPEGRDSAPFVVGVAPVLTATTAQITARFRGVTRTVGIQVQPVVIDAVKVKPDSVTGGVSTDGYAIFQSEAPANAVVTLRTDHPELAQVPPQVRTKAGEWSTEFEIQTKPVTAVTPVRVIAGFNGKERAALLTLLPVGLTGFVIQPFGSGSSAVQMGLVLLSGPAPEGGATVFLRTDAGPHPMRPDRVLVPAGARTARFTVEDLGGAELPVTVTASYGGVRRTAIIRGPAATGIRFQPARVVGGRATTGTITLASPAPEGGITLQLVSDSPSLARPPASVKVPAGERTVSFPVTTSVVMVDRVVNISATGTGIAGTLEVVPPGLVSVTVEPASLTGGSGAVGRVTLSDPAPRGGVVIALVSAKPAATVPARVVVPEGATSATFPVSTVPVASTTGIVIVAARGEISRAAGLTVLPPTLVSLRLDPTRVVGGLPATGTVTLSAPAPAGGLKVSLWTSDLTVSRVPGSVTVPAGTASASFRVETDPVTRGTKVVIGATRQAGSQTATLMLLPRS